MYFGCMHKQDELKLLLLALTETQSCVFVYCRLELMYALISFSFEETFQ